MTGEPIKIPTLEYQLNEKERWEANPVNAKYTLLHGGATLASDANVWYGRPACN